MEAMQKQIDELIARQAAMEALSSAHILAASRASDEQLHRSRRQTDQILPVLAFHNVGTGFERFRVSV